MPHSKQKIDTRPLSPHIQIYRWTLTMVLSILHRATGVVLYVGTILLAWWLGALATSAEAYALVQAFAGSWFGQCILFAYTWALFHHMFGGLRHFIWDMGRGFKLGNVEIMAHLAAIVPLLLAVTSWVLAPCLKGVF